jgi:hypothetical protein
LLIFIGYVVWWNWRWKKMQRRIASQRTGLDRDDYIAELALSGVSERIADALYQSVQPYCVNGVQLHPDDGLMGFYFDDLEDVEELIEELYEKTGLSIPARYDPHVTTALESARMLAVHLQSKLA